MYDRASNDTSQVKAAPNPAPNSREEVDDSADEATQTASSFNAQRKENARILKLETKKQETRAGEPTAQEGGDMVAMVRTGTARDNEYDHRCIHRRHACAETIRANRSADYMAVIDDRGNHRHTLGHRTQPLSFPRQTSRRKRRKTQIIDTSDKTKTRRSRYAGSRGHFCC